MNREKPDRCNPQPAPLKLSGRPKPGPGRHGSGKAPAEATAVNVGAATPAPPPKSKFSRNPSAAAAVLASADKAKPVAGRSLARQPSKAIRAAPAHSLLSLEDTISVTTALAVLRGEAVIVYIQTTGPDPLRDEVITIHARRVRKHRTITEFSLKVLLSRALPAATSAGGTGEAADRPPAKRQGVPLQEAVTRLLEFLGTHRQHVFVHGSAGVQAFLGQAARQYGMVIENPVGDVVDLARLAWPDRADYSVSGLAGELLPKLGPIQTTADATNAIQGLLQAAWC